jgi:hypothetical protein
LGVLTGAPVFNYLTSASVGLEADLFTTIKDHITNKFPIMMERKFKM